MADWPLSPGDTIRRVDLHNQWGGSRQNGISPSTRSANIFIFTDAASGEQHGYIDSWKEDGCFHYTGEGQRGDQRMRGGNRALLEAAAAGRALRVFQGARGNVTYLGRFTLDEVQPCYTTDAPETGQGPIRSVIVFRLRPHDIPAGVATGSPAPSSTQTVIDVPVEEQYTERMVIEPSRAVYEAERREARLVQQFKVFLEGLGHQPCRRMATPAGEARPLFNDVYIERLKLLIEAKGSIDRCSIRMALGQLLDYSRFAPPGTRKAVLLPSQPRDDLMDLLASAGVTLVIPEGRAFVLIDEHGHREHFDRV